MAYLRMDEEGTEFRSEDWLTKVVFMFDKKKQQWKGYVFRALAFEDQWIAGLLEELDGKRAEDYRNYLLTAAHNVPDATAHKKRVAASRQFNHDSVK